MKFLITFYITHVEKLLKTHLEAMCMFLCNITHVKNLQLVWKRVGKLSKVWSNDLDHCILKLSTACTPNVFITKTSLPFMEKKHKELLHPSHATKAKGWLHVKILLNGVLGEGGEVGEARVLESMDSFVCWGKTNLFSKSHNNMPCSKPQTHPISKEHPYSRLSHLDVVMAHITIMFSFNTLHIYFTLKTGWNYKFYLMNMSWIRILCWIWLINMNMCIDVM